LDFTVWGDSLLRGLSPGRVARKPWLLFSIASISRPIKLEGPPFQRLGAGGRSWCYQQTWRKMWRQIEGSQKCDNFLGISILSGDIRNVLDDSM
ncbi:hypothetical protein AVEN_195966-1, partial [Araneus ventricosus]